MNFKRSIKLFWQRLTRGWSDSDLWSLDITIAEFVLPRLKRLKEIQCGYPSNLTEKKWDTILDHMIYSMESVINQFDDFEFNEETEKRIKKGLYYFGKYFRSLWD